MMSCCSVLVVAGVPEDEVVEVELQVLLEGREVATARGQPNTTINIRHSQATVTAGCIM